MEALIILLGLIILGGILLAANLLFSEPAKVIFCEGPHKWVTDQNEKLFCESCNYRPGDNQ